jgi:hypothetical protein
MPLWRGCPTREEASHLLVVRRPSGVIANKRQRRDDALFGRDGVSCTKIMAKECHYLPLGM